MIENIYKIKKIKNVHLVDSLFEDKTYSLYNLNNSKKFYFYKIDLSKKNSLSSFKNISIIIHIQTHPHQKVLKSKNKCTKIIYIHLITW